MPSVARHLLFLVENKPKADPSLRPAPYGAGLRSAVTRRVSRLDSNRSVRRVTANYGQPKAVNARDGLFGVFFSSLPSG